MAETAWRLFPQRKRSRKGRVIHRRQSVGGFPAANQLALRPSKTSANPVLPKRSRWPGGSGGKSVSTPRLSVTISPPGATAIVSVSPPVQRQVDRRGSADEVEER